MRVLLLCLLLGAEGLWKHLAIFPRGVMVLPPYLPRLPLSSRRELRLTCVSPSSPPPCCVKWEEEWRIQNRFPLTSFRSSLNHSEHMWLLHQEDQVYSYILLWKHNEGLFSPLGGRSLGSDSLERLCGDLSGEQPRW